MMPRFTRPGKQEAYESALAAVAIVTDDLLLVWGWQLYSVLSKEIRAFYPDLPRADVRGVVAAALRVERGRRVR